MIFCVRSCMNSFFMFVYYIIGTSMVECVCVCVSTHSKQIFGYLSSIFVLYRKIYTKQYTTYAMRCINIHTVVICTYMSWLYIMTPSMYTPYLYDIHNMCTVRVTNLHITYTLCYIHEMFKLEQNF